MSRIGRLPVPVPSGVDVAIDGRRMTVTGPKGTLTRDLPPILPALPALRRMYSPA